MSIPPPTIIVPGITASTLRDEYELPPENVWTAVLHKRYDHLTLHPQDQRFEMRGPARVQPGNAFELIYEDLVAELRHELSDEHGTVPVYPFAYDWRKPLDEIEAQLDAFIREVVDRTKLLRHYHKAKYAEKPKVNLVGHSMGGIVIAGYLKRFGGTLTKRVVTLGSPFHGSCEAVFKIATGTANLGMDPGRSRERETARLTPALYHLLPSFSSAFETHGFDPETEANIFNPTLWQPSVVRSINKVIDDYGLVDCEDAETVFLRLLQQAKSHRERLEELNLEEVDLCPSKDWLAIAGADADTLIGFDIDSIEGQPQFRLNPAKRTNRWDDADATQRFDTGDGTVPLRSAVPAFLSKESVVCVTPRDFGVEMLDRALMTKAGFHAMLPRMNMLQRLVVRFFTGAEDRYGNTWGCSLPGVEEWKPPLPL